MTLVLLFPGYARAEPRWLSCTYNDAGGRQNTLAVMFDQDRNLAALLEDGQLVEGANTSITFQAIRSRFQRFFLTYNRNDGTLALAMTGGGFTAGMLHGSCRRSTPPPGAPR
ncbi:MAG TPA: hypothetical protein VEC14_08955 [Reyranellaceae bacterium]|nr:hypothetical protein [Reyranellaceae bacterium]